MKKLLLSLTLSIFLLSGYSQVSNQTINERLCNKRTVNQNLLMVIQNESQMDRSNAFYHEDFESVTTPALPINMTTNSNSNGGFYTGNASAANSGGYWPVPTHTVFAMCNDDAGYLGAGGDYDASLEILNLPTFDLTNESGLFLSFAYYHDQMYGGGDAIVETSIDGGITWTAELTLEVAEEWQLGAVDLTSFSGQSSLDIRITWSDNNTWATGLAVDDITIDILPDYQLNAVSSAPWFSDYPMNSQIPKPQAENTTVDAEGVIQNFGLQTQTNVTLEMEILENGMTVASESSNANDINSLAYDTLTISGSYSPSNLGTYTTSLMFESDSNSTSAIDRSFEVTENIYANDAGLSNASGGFYYLARTEYAYDWATEFFVYKDWQAKSISTVFARTNGLPGGVYDVYFVLYELLDNGEYISIWRSNDYTLSDNDFNGDWFTMDFGNLITLEAGKVYAAAVGSYPLFDYVSGTTPSEEAIGIQVSGTLDVPWIQGIYDTYNNLGQGESWLWNITTDALMIRLNMSKWDIGIEENKETNIELFPNPATNDFVLKSNLPNGDYNIKINNVIGQEVYSSTVNINEPLNKFDISYLENGIYFITISSDEIEETIQFVKK